MPTLLERLGFAPTDRAVIVNGDDFGMSRSAVRGISTLLESGGINSSTIMTPCSWAPLAGRIAAENPSFDVGVHLTLTSEWEDYRWGPLSAAPSLRDDCGYFPATCLAIEQQATNEDVATEFEAQISRAMALGVVPTHADNHMGSVYGLATGRDFLETVLHVCAKYGLPFRLPRNADLYGTALPEPIKAALEAMLQARCALADELGVVLPDYTWTYAFETEPGTSYESVRHEMKQMIRSTRSGVTEIYVHPFEVDDELIDIAPNPAKRGWELAMFQDPEILELFETEGIHRIGWRDLQDVQNGN